MPRHFSNHDVDVSSRSHVKPVRSFARSGKLLIGLLVSALVAVLAVSPVSGHSGDDSDLLPANLSDEAINLPEPDPFGEVPRQKGNPVRVPAGAEGCDSFTRGQRNLRIELGLSRTVERNGATEVRYGINVTKSEAKFLDRNMIKREAIDSKVLTEELTNSLGAEFFGLTWDAKRGVVEAHVSSNAVGDADKLLKQSGAIGAEGTVQAMPVTPGRPVPPELHTEALLKDWGTDDQSPITLEFDQSCAVTLVTVTSESDKTRVEGLLADGPDYNYVIVVDDQMSFEQASRDDLHNPHIGGLRLAVFQGALGGSYCTSSIPFENEANTTQQYVITAAHCLKDYPSNNGAIGYAANTNIYNHISTFNSTTEIGRWNGAYYKYGGNADVMWQGKKYSLNGSQYTMTHGGNHTTVGMGWWLWHPSLSIQDEAICHSGLNWGIEVCGAVSQTNYIGNHMGANWAGMFVASFPSYPGDSGGTVWTPRSNGNWYTGIVSTTFEYQGSIFTIFTHVGNVDQLRWYLDGPVNMT